jgi:hypothetical protein
LYNYYEPFRVNPQVNWENIDIKQMIPNYPPTPNWVPHNQPTYWNHVNTNYPPVVNPPVPLPVIPGKTPTMAPIDYLPMPVMPHTNGAVQTVPIKQPVQNVPGPYPGNGFIIDTFPESHQVPQSQGDFHKKIKSLQKQLKPKFPF